MHLTYCRCPVANARPCTVDLVSLLNNLTQWQKVIEMNYLNIKIARSKQMKTVSNCTESQISCRPSRIISSAFCQIFDLKPTNWLFCLVCIVITVYTIAKHGHHLHIFTVRVAWWRHVSIEVFSLSYSQITFMSLLLPSHCSLHRCHRHCFHWCYVSV